MIKKFKEMFNKDSSSESSRVYPEFYNENDYGQKLLTIEDWKMMIDGGYITHYNGHGFWAKNDMISEDDVFETPQLDATHVVWYNN